MQLFKPNITQAAIDSVVEVLRSGWIGLGPKVKEFETQFAAYCGAKYAVALNSATAALHLALVVSNVKEGDEVISTPLTFVSTNHVILYQKAIPVFADIDSRTYCLSTASVKKLITRKTRAIVCVHYGGHPCDLDALYELAKSSGITLIEDAAHACGASYKKRKVGSFGLTCFSFHAVKNLPMGDGGMVTTNDEEQYHRMMRLRWLGIDKDTFARSSDASSKRSAYAWQYDVPEVGYKYHMNDINAAIGIEQLKVLDQHNEYRRKLARLYDEKLGNDGIIALPYVSPDVVTAQHLYAIQVKKRDKLIDRLKAHDIAPGVHYIPNNTFPMYRQCRADVVNTMKLWPNLVSLPMHTLLAESDIEKIAQVINQGW